MKVYKADLFIYNYEGDLQELKGTIEVGRLPFISYVRNIQENDLEDCREPTDSVLTELFPIPNGLSLDDTPLKREYDRVKSIMLKLIKENGELKASNTKLSKDNEKFAKIAELINTIKHS